MAAIQTFDFGVITSQPALVARCEFISKEFSFSLKIWKNLEDFMAEPAECRALMASCVEAEGLYQPAEFAQCLRFHAPSSFVICIVSRSLKKDVAVFVRKSGADMVLLDNEVDETSKIEFVVSQTVRARYMPFKVSDLVPETPLFFDIYHLLPQRQKFLKFALSGDTVSAEKIQKLNQVGELYVARADATQFDEYIKSLNDHSVLGQQRRCRSQFLLLSAKFLDLLVLLSDQGSSNSYGEGQSLTAYLRTLVGDLLSCMGTGLRVSETVNTSVIGQFGSLERSPAIAAYAGVFALHMELDTTDVMLAALMSDLGLLFVPPSVTKSLRDENLSGLKKDLLDEYRRYPLVSLDTVLNRKLMVEERVRKIMLAKHERADGTGFPHQVSSIRIPIEAQLIQLCEQLDRKSLLRLGQARVPFADVKRELFSRLNQDGRFSPAFVSKVMQIPAE